MPNLLTRRAAAMLLLSSLIFLPHMANAALPQQANESETTLIRAVRMFDGELTTESTDVLIKDGLIHSIGKDLPSPESALIIDGKGLTLMPGLIDCHVHAYFDGHLVQSAEFGVTSVMDMMSMPFAAANHRKKQTEGKANHRADFFSAGAAVTVDGGHGTQFGFKVPLLASAEEAEAFINDRIREGSDYIKIIHEPGTAFGFTRPTLTDEMLKAAIEATLKRDKLAVAHVGTREGAKKAIEYGISGLVHIFADEKITDEMIKKMKTQGTFVVPTTVVIQNVTGPVTVNSIIDDPFIGPLLNTMDLQSLGRTFPVMEEAKNTRESLHHNILAIHQAGIPILAGTDSPNPGTTHGASMHHELELLCEIGLSNKDALAAATSRAADAFRLDDRGRIKRGRRADLLLVTGNPLKDIKATRNISRVWKAGVAIERAKRQERLQKRRDKATQTKEPKRGKKN